MTGPSQEGKDQAVHIPSPGSPQPLSPPASPDNTQSHGLPVHAKVQMRRTQLVWHTLGGTSHEIIPPSRHPCLQRHQTRGGRQSLSLCTWSRPDVTDTPLTYQESHLAPWRGGGVHSPPQTTEGTCRQCHRAEPQGPPGRTGHTGARPLGICRLREGGPALAHRRHRPGRDGLQGREGAPNAAVKGLPCLSRGFRDRETLGAPFPPR